MDKRDNINEKFERRKSGVECPMCPDNTQNDVLAELRSGNVHLQNDADYLGYCILIFRRHAVELYELTEEERRQWIEDISRIGDALRRQCEPAKLNVTMMGNMVPHLHCHIIPRYPDDPEWGHPPVYRRPADRRQLSVEDYEALRTALSERLQ